MKNYRIAIIRQKFRTDGGAENFISNALMALDNQNLELNIITRDWKTEKKGNWHIHICNPTIWGRISQERGFAKSVYALLQSQQFDIVQSHERISGCDIYRAGDGLHCKWIMQRSRILPRWKTKILINDCYHRYVMNAEKIVLRSPDLKAIICNSKMVKNEIIENFFIDEKKIHVIYNSIDSNYFVPVNHVQRIKLRHIMDLPEDATVFCFVGSSFERKGLLSAIKAIIGTAAYLIILGQDKSEKRYRSFVNSIGYKKQIRFFGMHKKMLPFYQVSDCLLLPTLYDPFPNVILEAMSCGLSVITSDSCGGSEFIEQGRNGFFCDALDIKKLREAIMVISSTDRAHEMSRISREKVTGLTSEKLSSQLISLYRKLCN